MQTILLLKSAFLCVSRFFGLSSFDTVTTLILSRLASFLPFFEVIPEIYCKYAYFIEKGILRAYWVVDGEEYTTSFGAEGCIVFSMDELYYNKKSEEYVETLEEVEAYRINISDLKNLMETNLELCNWGRIIHQNEYRRLHRSHKERLSLPAKERYEEFQKQFPEICKR